MTSTASSAGADAELQAPLVSVIIPAYRVTAFIAETLESVFRQSFNDYEVILVNDGCPDTASLEQAIAPFRGRLRYVRQENAGPASARNHGIRLARGTLIAHLDGDDQWLPGFLSAQVRFLKANPEVDAVFTDAVFFGGPHDGHRFTTLNRAIGAATFASLLRHDVVLLTSSMLARRECIERAGLYDETIRGTEDYDLWLRLAAGGSRLAFQREVLVRYRRRSGSLSSQERSMLTSALRVLDKAEQQLTFTNEERAALETGRTRLKGILSLLEAKDALGTGDIAHARHAWDAVTASIPPFRLWAIRFALRVVPRLVIAAYRRKHRNERLGNA